MWILSIRFEIIIKKVKSIAVITFTLLKQKHNDIEEPKWTKIKKKRNEIPINWNVMDWLFRYENPIYFQKKKKLRHAQKASVVRTFHNHRFENQKRRIIAKRSNGSFLGTKCENRGSKFQWTDEFSNINQLVGHCACLRLKIFEFPQSSRP